MNRQDTDDYFMGKTLELATRAYKEGELPVGALILDERDVIRGIGYRTKKGNARLDHAEMLAIRQATTDSRHLRDMTLYTTLEPCIMCFGAALNVRIKRVVYALEDPYGGATAMLRGELPLRHRTDQPEVTSSILKDSARELFGLFFETTDEPFWKNPDNPLVQICRQAS